MHHSIRPREDHETLGFIPAEAASQRELPDRLLITRNRARQILDADEPLQPLEPWHRLQPQTLQTLGSAAGRIYELTRRIPHVDDLHPYQLAALAFLLRTVLDPTLLMNNARFWQESGYNSNFTNITAQVAPLIADASGWALQVRLEDGQDLAYDAWKARGRYARPLCTGFYLVHTAKSAGIAEDSQS